MRKKLINLLGGYTAEEMKESNHNSAQIGKYQALLDVQSFMRNCNGEEAKTWCDLVWRYVTVKIEEIRKSNE